MISNTWVAPPVGSGSAGTPSRSTNRSAKLFSLKSAMSPPSVLSPSVPSQRSIWSLTCSGSGRRDCWDMSQGELPSSAQPTGRTIRLDPPARRLRLTNQAGSRDEEVGGQHRDPDGGDVGRTKGD